MANIPRRLDRVIKSTLETLPILPVKVEGGILVGDILIVSDYNIKHLYRGEDLLYKDISLNKAAVAMANLLSRRIRSELVNKIYRADQAYGRWFIDSQMLRTHYEKAVKNNDPVKIDIFWARYTDSRAKATEAKQLVERLVNF